MTPSKHVPSAGPTGSSPTPKTQAVLLQYAQVTATHQLSDGEDSQCELPAKRESYTRGQSENVQYLEYVNMTTNVTGSKQPTEKNNSENGEDDGDSQMAAMARLHRKDLQQLPQAESSGMRQSERMNRVTTPSTRVVRAPSGENQIERVNMMTIPSSRFVRCEETFSGHKNENLNLFLRKFNLWFEISNLPEREKGRRLAIQLKGQAAEVVMDLDDEAYTDYEKIRECLLRNFQRNETDQLMAKAAIEKLDYHRMESFVEFITELTSLTKKAHPQKKGTELEERVFESAMRLLPVEFIVAMNNRDVTNLNDLKKFGPKQEANLKLIAMDKPKSRRDQETVKVINHYENFPEYDEEKINAMAGPVQRASQNVGPQCYNCGEPGHIARYCRRFQQDQTGFNPSEYDDRKTSIMCYQCQGLGHYAYECPSAKYESSMYQTVCQLCGYQGHSANECAQWTGMFQSMAGLAIQGQGYRQMEVPQQVNTVQAQGTGISTKTVTWHDRQGALQEQNEVPRKKKCHICRRRTHEMKDCWMNPNSENFRPEMSEHSRFRHWQR